MLDLDNSALALALAPPPPGVAAVDGDRQQHGAHYGAHHADHDVPDQLLSSVELATEVHNHGE